MKISQKFLILCIIALLIYIAQASLDSACIDNGKQVTVLRKHHHGIRHRRRQQFQTEFKKGTIKEHILQLAASVLKKESQLTNVCAPDWNRLLGNLDKKVRKQFGIAVKNKVDHVKVRLLDHFSKVISANVRDLSQLSKSTRGSTIMNQSYWRLRTRVFSKFEYTVTRFGRSVADTILKVLRRMKSECLGKRLTIGGKLIPTANCSKIFSLKNARYNKYVNCVKFLLKKGIERKLALLLIEPAFGAFDREAIANRNQFRKRRTIPCKLCSYDCETKAEVVEKGSKKSAVLQLCSKCMKRYYEFQCERVACPSILKSTPEMKLQALYRCEVLNECDCNMMKTLMVDQHERFSFPGMTQYIKTVENQLTTLKSKCSATISFERVLTGKRFKKCFIA